MIATIMPYAALLGLMSIALAMGAGFFRAKLGISIGDGGNKELLLRMRRHANFAEWVPITLIVIALLESSGAPDIAIHALGGGLVASRIAHAIGLKADTIESILRAIGAGGNALVLVVASVWLLVNTLM